MKAKKFVSILMMLAMLCSSFALAQGYTAGTYEAAVKGFGGDVKAVVTFDAEKITDVVLTGDAETPTIGGAALETVKEQILAAQGTEIDGVAGATVTVNAVKDAVNACIAQATGAVAEAKVAADGVYTGEAKGFKSQIVVELTMKDNAIAALEVKENNDTWMIGGIAANLLVADIVENQSMNLDVVSGATVTSNALMAAVSNALDAAGADVAAYKSAPVAMRAAETKEMDTQIVVIGGGLAGLTAAMEAADQGADVILLEKKGVFSGSTTRSEGYVMGADTAVQKLFGIADTQEDFYNDMFECYADEPMLDTNLLRKTVEDSDNLIDWLTNHGVIWENVIAISKVAPRDNPRAHVSWRKGDGFTQKLIETAQANDKITILMNTPATEIIKENGVVVGVKATNEFGDDITIHADATILCAGSYGSNIEMIKELNSNLSPIFYSGCGEGDGWTLAENAGAKMVEIGYMAGSYSYMPYPTRDSSRALPGSTTTPIFDVMEVNTNGKRLINEDAFSFDFGDMVYDSGAKIGWAIGGKAFDEKYPHLYGDGKDVIYNVDGKDYFMAYRADTIEELAAMTDMDAETLKASIERYNASCDAGVDEEFGKDPQYMTRIDAPYTAMMMVSMVADGYSGCVINENAQVIDTEGNAIPGFYAAGACALPQIIGNRYYGCGTLLTICGVYGLAAAQHAVNYIQ